MWCFFPTESIFTLNEFVSLPVKPEKTAAAKRPQVVAPSKVARLLPGPVTEGTHFEVILRDGVPIREAWKLFEKGRSYHKV